MIKTDILTLLDSKQVWELSDKELSSVKVEMIRLARKCENEQNLRVISEGQDTPLFDEVYGG